MREGEYENEREKFKIRKKCERAVLIFEQEKRA